MFVCFICLILFGEMHLCTFAVGEGEMLPVFVSKN